MSSKREMPGLADMIATVISPVLIMAMVGALIFFLIEVLYGGEYSGQLRWTFFFYVFGSVLIARIAIEFGDARAGIYAAILGIAAFLAMLRFVEYPDNWIGQLGPVINIGLLALVWWCSRKLVWDCTFIDDSRESSDQSLLEASGLENLERPAEWREPEPIEEEPEKPIKDAGPLGWLQSYLRWRKKQDKKPHTPGVWVVYFSLAALPIFGLGQSLIDPEDGASRSFTFWTMVVYVASGLGLLMTTAFLGLRRYLKQRKLQIPATMAGIWLGIGSLLILIFLVIAAILPRPNSETPLVDLSSIVGSKERDASQFGQGSGQGKGDGSGGEEKSEDAKSDSSAEGKSKDAGKGEGQQGGNKGQGEQGKSGEKGQSNQSGGDQKNGNKPGEQGDKNQQPNKDPNAQKSENRSGADKQASKSSSSSRSRNSSRSGSSRGPVSMGSLGKVGTIIKWIVFAALALVVGYFLFRHGLKFLANFMAWARQLLDLLNNFWARLFGWQVTEREPEVIEDFDNFKKPARPFSDFHNPFDTGDAQRLSPSELVKYSFSALEAWAWEHDKSRGPDETPLEFAHRLAEDYQALEKDAPRLAALYARLAYARGALPAVARQNVEEFWRQLEAAQFEAKEPVASDGA